MENYIEKLLLKYFEYEEKLKNQRELKPVETTKPFDNPKVLDQLYAMYFDEGERILGTDVYRHFSDSDEYYDDINNKEILAITRFSGHTKAKRFSYVADVEAVYYIDRAICTKDEYHNFVGIKRSR